ncbi:hypothetical protein [Brevibacillus marinus]|uniref:hypothetical protein n=1 Tax=Brevibacillus marinus TaxID=2496837 RepID=UPI000F83E9D8|nr:hypothetical protein [Brevibacillus marinus]
MFQPAPILSTLLRRVSPDGARLLEFSPGQVFQGTVLKLYPDNSALVQVGGVQLRARLETPLEAGQKAWLQVQPTAHPVTLKVLASPEGSQQSAAASLGNLLRSLGLADNKETRMVVQTMIRAGLPVSKEAVELFVSLAKTQGTSEHLLQALLVAQTRNLPLTKDVVLALSAFFAAPLSDRIQAFLREADRLVQQRAGQADPLVALIQSLRQQLGSLPLQLSPAADWPSARQAAPTAAAAPAPASRTGTGKTADGADGADNPQNAFARPLSGPGQRLPQTAGGAGGMAGAVSGQPGNGIVAGNSAVGQPPQAASPSPAAHAPSPAAAANPAGTARAAFPSAAALQQSPGGHAAEGAVQGPGAAVLPGAGATAAAYEPLHALRAGSSAQGAPGQPPAGTFAAASASGAPDQAAPSGYEQGQTAQPARLRPDSAGSLPPAGPAHPSAVGEPERANSRGSEHGQVGVEQRAPAFAADERGNPIRAFLERLGLLHERQIASLRLPQADQRAAERSIESVKSLLLQLTQAHAASLPKALAEAAESLLQQVTGQQLMLLPPQHQAISQLLIQLPLRSDSGEETAFIQIEAKKKGSGELDPENCRLFFHLDLERLGVTMLDVNIVNRIVNVQIYNDRPWLDAAVQELRETFGAQLREVGYQLSGLRVQAMPEERQQAKTEAAGYLPSAYRGVDIRV